MLKKGIQESAADQRCAGRDLNHCTDIKRRECTEIRNAFPGVNERFV
jgi:hypothetical protein